MIWWSDPLYLFISDMMAKIYSREEGNKKAMGIKYTTPKGYGVFGNFTSSRFHQKQIHYRGEQSTERFAKGFDHKFAESMFERTSYAYFCLLVRLPILRRCRCFHYVPFLASSLPMVPAFPAVFLWFQHFCRSFHLCTLSILNFRLSQVKSWLLYVYLSYSSFCAISRIC